MIAAFPGCARLFFCYTHPQAVRVHVLKVVPHANVPRSGYAKIVNIHHSDIIEQFKVNLLVVAPKYI